MATSGVERLGKGLQPDVDGGHQHQRTPMSGNCSSGRSIHGAVLEGGEREGAACADVRGQATSKSGNRFSVFRKIAGRTVGRGGAVP